MNGLISWVNFSQVWKIYPHLFSKQPYKLYRVADLTNHVLSVEIVILMEELQINQALGRDFGARVFFIIIYYVRIYHCDYWDLTLGC